MRSAVLDLGIGVLELLLAATVLWHVWRFKRGFPWLIALTCFFFLRGVDRLVVGASGAEPQTVGFLLDAFLVVVLALLLVGIERMAHGLELAEDKAHYREQEYGRALLDYRRLARHRLATPLTAILGGVRALQELAPDDERLRSELLDIIEDAAMRLQTVSLEPSDRLEPDERGLRPAPRLDRSA